jgi:hypothetical protein
VDPPGSRVAGTVAANETSSTRTTIPDKGQRGSSTQHVRDQPGAAKESSTPGAAYADEAAGIEQTIRVSRLRDA